MGGFNNDAACVVLLVVETESSVVVEDNEVENTTGRSCSVDDAEETTEKEWQSLEQNDTKTITISGSARNGGTNNVEDRCMLRISFFYVVVESV